MKTQERQFKVMILKQKELVLNTTSEHDRAVAIGMWAGFLNGLRMVNVITQEKYNQAYNELLELVSEMEEKV
jgi:predicted RNA polymerase sigma factor